MEDTFLETERLIVKFPTVDDYAAIHALEIDKEVMKYIADGSTSSPERTRAKLNKDIAHFAKHHFGTGLVYEKATGEFVGQAGLTYLEYNDNQPEVELDYLLHKAFWGKGYATELAKKSIEWGFKHLSLDKLIAVTDLKNKGSQNVLTKAGLKYTNDIWCYNKTVKLFVIHPLKPSRVLNLFG
jgi:RimJ/RimL family protein N-acetyltransferase